MEIGKLPNDILKSSILSKIETKSKDILVGPGVGEDCTGISFGDEVCVLTTDPITSALNNAGKIGVHICCNDIASSGVRPIGVLVTILAPPASSLSDITDIMKEVNETCGELGIEVLGGHTEITDAVNRTVLSITAVGKGSKNNFIKTGGARLGDEVIVTGFAGLEGTAILSKDYEEYLSKFLDKNLVESAQNLLKSISVVRVGQLASEYGVNAMHDATEGGILGAIWEVAEASKLGVYINKEDIPVKEETKAVCNALNIDPLKLISSGSMVISAKAGSGLCKFLEDNNIKAKVVGRITESDMVLFDNGIEKKILPPEADEIYKVRV